MSKPAFQRGVLVGRGEAIALLAKLMAEGLEGLKLLAEFSTRLTQKAYPEIPKPSD